MVFSWSHAADQVGDECGRTTWPLPNRAAGLRADEQNLSAALDGWVRIEGRANRGTVCEIRDYVNAIAVAERYA